MKRKFKHCQRLKVWIQIYREKGRDWDVAILGKEGRAYYVGKRLPDEEVHNFKFAK